jgi:hypothetical protein
LQVDNSTADVETKLQGTGPWNLGRDVQLIHTPGHTEVSCWISCLLFFFQFIPCLVKGLWREERVCRKIVFPQNLLEPSFKNEKQWKERKEIASFPSGKKVLLSFFLSLMKRKQNVHHSPFPSFFLKYFFLISLAAPS